MAIPVYPPMATLGIFADKLDPSRIDHVLSVKPEISARKGEPLRQLSSGKAVPARTGTWFLTTEHRALGGPADHLNWLVTLVQSHIAQLRDAVPDIKIDLSLLVFDGNFEPADLPRDLLLRAIAVGDLEIEVPDRHADYVITSANIHDYMEI